MSTYDRRRFKRAFSKALTASGDCCEFCRKPLQQNINKFDDLAGIALAVGECCVKELESEIAPSEEVIEIIANFSQTNQRAGVNHLSPECIKIAFEAIQLHFEALNTLSEKLMKQAGIQSMPSNIFLEDTSWKADDAAWFKNHPHRSHRLRAMFQAETSTLPTEILTAGIPDKHRYEVLVRQVEVGKRIRTIFCRNTDVPIPDVEEVIHSIFDIVSRPDNKGVVTLREIEALAFKYGVALSAEQH